MDKFGLIGYPIAHSQSPHLFKRAYGGKWDYELIETEDFEEAWSRFLADYKAINVTAPFKENAFAKADFPESECVRVGATNLCVKQEDGIHAYNSDYRAVKAILEGLPGVSTAAIIGYGGAGKAALAAAEDAGLQTALYRHTEIAGGVNADVIVYTLPKAAPGMDKLECAHLLEANYRDPVLTRHPGYIPGTEWLRMQGVLGYELMTGETPQL